jgi:hypothetical protein
MITRNSFCKIQLLFESQRPDPLCFGVHRGNSFSIFEPETLRQPLSRAQRNPMWPVVVPASTPIRAAGR